MGGGLKGLPLHTHTHTHNYGEGQKCLGLSVMASFNLAVGERAVGWGGKWVCVLLGMDSVGVSLFELLCHLAHFPFTSS